ncbi:hypothetical protein BKA64DRAFT_196979 [Cadophora sp. MPI-SDFR-AT-0126]|nr:hypothetical protein BKA64DRAFT_196979 [Leotiomycetes sp. MPI-SDFR-AT-0126]
MLKWPPFLHSTKHSSLSIRSTLQSTNPHCCPASLRPPDSPSPSRRKLIPPLKTWVWFANLDVDLGAPVFPPLLLPCLLPGPQGRSTRLLPCSTWSKKLPPGLGILQGPGPVRGNQKAGRTWLVLARTGRAGISAHGPILPEIMSSLLFLVNRSQCDLGDILISGYLQPPNLARRFIYYTSTSYRLSRHSCHSLVPSAFLHVDDQREADLFARGSCFRPCMKEGLLQSASSRRAPFTAAAPSQQYLSRISPYQNFSTCSHWPRQRTALSFIACCIETISPYSGTKTLTPCSSCPISDFLHLKCHRRTPRLLLLPCPIRTRSSLWVYHGESISLTSLFDHIHVIARSL